jgi:protein tyrosine phosphatase
MKRNENKKLDSYKDVVDTENSKKTLIICSDSHNSTTNRVIDAEPLLSDGEIISGLESLNIHGARSDVTDIRTSLAERRMEKFPKRLKQKNSQSANIETRNESKTTSVAMRPPKLDTNKLRKLASQKTPEFSPLSANSSNRGLALLELSSVLYQAMFLPTWFSPWVLLHNRNKLKRHYYKIYTTIKELEIDRLNDTSQDHNSRVGGAAINMEKNRYQDILPFDKNRVLLSTKDNNYINASLIKSMCQKKTYITTQGPLPQTFGDFWHMVWDQKSATIVMLTQEEEKRRIKCHRYWPQEVGTFKRYHTATINNCISYKVFCSDEFHILDGNAVVRELIVKREILWSDHDVYQPEIRRIRLAHYLAWFDNESCDPRSLITFIDIANEIEAYSTDDFIVHSSNPDHQKGPMIVHCSAGIGRTATFCVIDSVLVALAGRFPPSKEEKLPEGDLIALTIDHFRKQRAGAVQTIAQYLLCYDAVLLRMGDWYSAGIIPTWDIIDPATIRGELQLENSSSAVKRFSWSIVYQE